jgi:phage/plasmid-like protein (TIGR03299 family)
MIVPGLAPGAVTAVQAEIKERETMTVIDVNEQFDTDRAAQLARIQDRTEVLEAMAARGEARKLANGEFQITSGWDRGEIFNAQGLPQTGLDLRENGEAAFYSKDVPAWHGLGTVVPGGLRSATEILKFSGQLYTVDLMPTPHPNPVTGLSEIIPGTFTSYRTDTGAPLGVVGNRFTPLQNMEAYSMLDELTGYMPTETAGTFDGGRRTFVTAKAPDDLILDPDGIADAIKQYVAIINRHDGRGSLTAFTTPWRIRCKNTEGLAVAGATRSIKIRHTRNALSKVAEARQVLGLARDYYAAFAKEETALIHTEFPSNQVDALINQVWDKDQDEIAAKGSKRAVTLDAQRRDRVHELFEMEAERCGPNAYAAERAITGYVDHDRPRKTGKRMTPLQALGEAVLADSNSEPKRTAHAKLMELVKR